VRGIDQKTLPRLELLFEPLENAVEGNDQRNDFARHIFDGKLRTRSSRVDLRCFFDDGTQASKRPAHDVWHGEKYRRQKNRQQGDINRIGAGKKRQKRRSCIRGSAEHDPDGSRRRLDTLSRSNLGYAAAAANIGVRHQMNVACQFGVDSRDGSEGRRVTVRRRDHEPQRLILRFQGA